MANSNPNDKKFEQQQSDAAIAGLKNQVEDNLGHDKDKNDEVAAEGIADNLQQSQSK